MKLLLCLFLQVFALLPNALPASDDHAQTVAKCDAAWSLLSKDWNDDSALLKDAREFMTDCSSHLDPQHQVRLLGRMGGALIGTKQYSEAIPILRECAREAIGMNGDYASCWERLGEAAAYEGACDAAETAFNAALAVPTTDTLSSLAHHAAASWLKHLYTAPYPGVTCSPRGQPSKSPSDLDITHAYGTAFFISPDGLLLTNEHVVQGCKSLSIGMGTEARIVSRDAENDLALLKADWNSKNFVQFRSGMLVEIGEPVMAFGFPLPGTLSSDGVATNGIVNALTGIHDDPGTLQFSAAVQPGNSGGPLFDGGGHVIGVVEAKLDSLRMAQTLGVIPENVGFAIQWDRIEGFLKNADVKPSLATSSNSVTSTDIAQFARRVTVSVDCVQ